VVVIEHNLDVIKTADWVLDLGPDGGVNGGEIVAQGTPEEVVKEPRSFTGRYLAPLLERGSAPVAATPLVPSAVEGRPSEASDPDKGAAAPKRVRRRKSETVAAAAE